MKNYPSIQAAILGAINAIRFASHDVHTEKWQGMAIDAKPDMAMKEVLNFGFTTPVPRLELECLVDRDMSFDLDPLREQVKPNLPWADDHFEERVGRQPLNPGVQWANWPYSKSADRFRDQGEFSHTYMERYWPKMAGMYPGGILPWGRMTGGKNVNTMMGYRFPYGDLDDMVRMLAHEPGTRQAFLPVWFPEDTGVIHGGRVPCSIGYHFIQRGPFLHVSYWLRSCDITRHFRDDIYLTIRLQLWVLDQCRRLNPDHWNRIQPGLYTMLITSLHCFINDWRLLK